MEIGLTYYSEIEHLDICTLILGDESVEELIRMQESLKVKISTKFDTLSMKVDGRFPVRDAQTGLIHSELVTFSIEFDRIEMEILRYNHTGYHARGRILHSLSPVHGIRVNPELEHELTQKVKDVIHPLLYKKVAA